MSDCVLAIDQGTSNTKALILDNEGAVRGRASVPVAIRYPQPGWVEQDGQDLWTSAAQAIDAALRASGESDVTAVAVSNQRESALVWERETGALVGPCVVWQCQRGAALCEDIASRGLAEEIHGRTGLQIDPMFSASKIRWLLDHIPNGQSRAERGELCAGTVDSWLLWNLTGGRVHACDLTNASRTLLLNLDTLCWDDDLLGLFGIPAAMLPKAGPSAHVYGETVACGRLPDGVPVAALIGDSHAALYGHAGFRPGAIKATYGTGSSLMTPVGSPLRSDAGISTTIAWARDRATYALEGNIYATGAAVQWFADLLGLADGGPEVEALARQVEGADGVYFVPAFVGLGAPHWSSAARGLISGITRGTTPGHLARATIESIAYQIRDVFDAMQASVGGSLNHLLADGGASRNDLLMQFQADILGCPVLRSGSGDMSALGAAYLAGLAVGLWRSEKEIEQLPRQHDHFRPRMSLAERDRLYSGWQQALWRALLDIES